MAFTDLHVNGPALIQVALDGTNYSLLGVTVDGPDVEPLANFEDVLGDDEGPFMPTDVQYMGEVATVRIELVRWDQNLLEQVIGRIRARSAGLIADADIGTLVRAASQHIGFQYASSARTGLQREKFRRFPCAYPDGPTPFKPGTRVTRYSLTFRCIRLAGVLYSLV